MYKLLKKSEWNRMQTRLTVQNQVLNDAKNQVKELESRCEMLELENQRMTSHMMEERRQSRRLEFRLKRELWEKTHAVLMAKEQDGDFVKEACGCYQNTENGKWEVVTGYGLFGGDDPERALFSSPKDARCYYELMRIFEMQPSARKSMEQYLESLKETA